MDETTVFQSHIHKEEKENIKEDDGNSVWHESADVCVSTCNDQERKHNLPITSKRIIYKNLAVVSASFCLLFTAYHSLQNLQSSINVADGVGTIGLTVAYVSVIISSAFLPPLLISKLGMKWTMAVSIFGYVAYISAAFHAT